MAACAPLPPLPPNTPMAPWSQEPALCPTLGPRAGVRTEASGCGRGRSPTSKQHLSFDVSGLCHCMWLHVMLLLADTLCSLFACELGMPGSALRALAGRCWLMATLSACPAARPVGDGWEGEEGRGGERRREGSGCVNAKAGAMPRGRAYMAGGVKMVNRAEPAPKNKAHGCRVCLRLASPPPLTRSSSAGRPHALPSRPRHTMQHAVRTARTAPATGQQAVHGHKELQHTRQPWACCLPLAPTPLLPLPATHCFCHAGPPPSSARTPCAVPPTAPPPRTHTQQQQVPSQTPAAPCPRRTTRWSRPQPMPPTRHA